MVIYECICEICNKEFIARRSKSNPKPKYCSQDCYSMRMKQKWNDKEYRAEMVKKHLDNPTRYWLGKKRPNMMGDKNPNWKTEKGYYISEGYKILYRPDFKHSDKRGCIKEHQYIWIKSHGTILKGYIIHHKDENRLNNDLENLQLMTRSEHMKLHRKLRN